MTADVALWPAHRLAEGIRRRDFSSRELLDLHLDRIARLNPALNAVVTLDVDGARRAAEAADAAVARDESVGPLHGIPMTVKDSFETAGIRTTCGVPAWDRVPERDADAVGRLRDAGAIIIGKTNVPAMAADWQTVNPIFGATNNPWDTSRSTGGSSGGAAAALAAGLTALELGSDIAGSIRLPSNWCGVCGRKPSWGLVPQRGHLPPPPGALTATDLAVMGPLARDVTDLELALDILAGPAAADATAWRLELPPLRASTLGRLRIATWLDDPAYPVQPDVTTVLTSAVAALADSGANLVDAAPPMSLPDVVRLHMELLYPLMDQSSSLRHRDWLIANERSTPTGRRAAHAGGHGARHRARPRRTLGRPGARACRRKPFVSGPFRLGRVADGSVPPGNRGAGRAHRRRATRRHPDRRAIFGGPHHAGGRPWDRAGAGWIRPAAGGVSQL